MTLVTFALLRWAIPGLIDLPHLEYDSGTPEKAVGFGRQILGKAGADFSRIVAPWASLFVLGVWGLALIDKYRRASDAREPKSSSGNTKS